MPNYLIEHQIRIRNRADNADLLTITSVRGGTNPYLVEPPTGDGSSFNPLSGEMMAASYTAKVGDWITAGTARVITAQLEDGNSRLQLGYLKTYVEWRRNGGAWLVLCVGFLTGVRLIDDATYELNVQDALRIQGGVELFNALGTTTIADFLTTWPNRGCFFGGPVKGSFYNLPDYGGWKCKVYQVKTLPRPMYWLEPRESIYGPTEWRPAPKKAADFANIAARLNAEARKLDQGTFNAESVALATVADAYSRNLRWRGLIYLIDGVPFRPIPPGSTGITYRGDGGEEQNDLVAPPGTTHPGIFAYLDGQAALTVGNTVSVRCLTVLPSEWSPIYIDSHPVDLLSTIATIMGLSQDAAEFLNHKKLLGEQLRYSERVTGTAQAGEFLKSRAFVPFQTAVRFDAQGRIVPFSTRIFPNTVPVKTIHDDHIVDGALRTPFDFEASQALQRVTYKFKTFSVLVGDHPSGVVENDVEVTWLNGDASAMPSGTHEVSVPGMIRPNGSGTEHAGPDWVRTIADPLFDRFGRGCPEFESDLIRGDGTTDADTINLGDEVLVRPKQIPNHNKRYGDDGSVGARAMQVKQITEGLGHRSVRLADSGPNANALPTKPTHTIAASTDRPRTVAAVTITNAAALNALGYAVRLQVAVGAAPATTEFVDFYSSAAGAIPATAIRMPRVLAGSKVHVRARSELVNNRPSDWSVAVNVTLTALDAATALAAASLAGDGSQEDLTWTIGANATEALTDIFVRAQGSAFATAIRQNVLPVGSNRFRLEGLTPNTAYTASVQHRDPETQDVAALTEVNFTSANSTLTLTAPLAPTGFSGPARAGNRGILAGDNRFRSEEYGLAVMATEYPGEIEVYEALETAVASGAYGASASVGRVPAVAGDWSIWKSFAPNDGLRRQLKARSLRDGTTASAFTSIVTIAPWTLTPLVMHGAPQGTVSIPATGNTRFSVDGGYNVGSYKWQASTSAYPADATVASAGTAIDGRTQNDVDSGIAQTLAQRIFITLVPFSGPNGTGVAGASIHLTATRHDFTATKTVSFGAAALAPNDAFSAARFDYSGITGYLRSVNHGANAQSTLLSMDLMVPDGCEITGLSISAWADNGRFFPPDLTFAVTSLSLIRVATNGTGTSVASASVSNIAGWNTAATALSESTTGRQYRLVVTLNPTGSTATAPADGDCRLATYSYTYTMPSSDKAL